MNRWIALAASCAVVAVAATPAFAQDKSKGAAAEKPKAEAKKGDKAASSDQRGVKVLFENDRVRVTETSYKPGAESGMVERSDRVVRALTDGTLEKTTQDGKKEIIQWKT